MSKMQRQKGATGEREWTKMLAAVGRIAKRALGQARDGGGDVPDAPVLWEVKRHARFAIYEHMKQAEAAMPQYEGCTIPAVALRGDNEEWLVVFRARDLLPILAPTKEDLL